jgi:hypothetical protein
MAQNWGSGHVESKHWRLDRTRAFRGVLRMGTGLVVSDSLRPAMITGVALAPAVTSFTALASFNGNKRFEPRDKLA